AQVAADAHVAVAGAGAGGRLQAGIGQALLEGGIEAGHQLIGGDGRAEPGGQHQPAQSEATQGEEVASVQDRSPVDDFSGAWPRIGVDWRDRNGYMAACAMPSSILVAVRLSVK